MTKLLAAGLLLVTSLAVPACAAPAAEDDEAVGQDTAELRELLPEELVGEIAYGDVKTVPYTSEPRYRAFWFYGQKGDWLNVKVSASTGENRVFASVVNEQYHTLRRGTRGVLPKTGKYYIAVRELDLQPATITIEFKKQTPHFVDAGTASAE